MGAGAIKAALQSTPQADIDAVFSQLSATEKQKLREALATSMHKEGKDEWLQRISVSSGYDETSHCKEEIINTRGQQLLKELPDDLKGDEEVMLLAVKQFGGSALRFASSPLLSNVEFILRCCAAYDASDEDEMMLNPLEVIPDNVKQNKAFVLSLMRTGGLSGELAYEFAGELQLDRELLLEAAKRFPRQLKSNSQAATDKELVLAAVSANAWDALQWVDHTLREDREVLLAAVRQNGEALLYLIEFCSMDQLRADKQIMLAAVTKTGGVLELACDELKADREIVLAAVKQDSAAFMYAADSVQNDPEIKQLKEEYEKEVARRATEERAEEE